MPPSEELAGRFASHALRVLREELETQTVRRTHAAAEVQEASEVIEELESAIRVVEDRLASPELSRGGLALGGLAPRVRGLPLPGSFTEGA